MQVQPYLFFEGRAEEALEFYKQALGAKVEMLMRYKDNPPEMGAGDEVQPRPTSAGRQGDARRASASATRR